MEYLLLGILSYTLNVICPLTGQIDFVKFRIEVSLFLPQGHLYFYTQSPSAQRGVMSACPAISGLNPCDV